MDEPVGRGPDRPKPPIGSAGSDPVGPTPVSAAGRSSPAAARGEPPFVERRSTPDGRRLRPPTPRVGLLLIAALVLAYLLYLGREALSPFVVGLLLVYLLDPLVERLSRARVPRWLAVLIVYAVVTLVVVEAMSLMLMPLVDQVSAVLRDLPSLAGQLDVQLQRLSEYYRGLQLPPQLRDAIDEWLAGLAEDGPGLDPGVLLPVVNVTASFLGAIVGYLIIPVWAFYLLKDRPTLTRRFDEILPAEWRADVWAVIAIVQRVFGQWVRAQLFLGVTVGAATFLGLLVLNELIDPVFGRFALLLAIIAGLFELLPIIGPILAAIPAILLAATAGLEAAVAAFFLYLLVQQVENNVLVPKIQGDAVELHPSVVMFALVVGGAIAGLLGAILALPITAAGRSVFRYLFGRLSADGGSGSDDTAAIDEVDEVGGQARGGEPAPAT
jgi:predicted PurR-regulated permease PerM